MTTLEKEKIKMDMQHIAGQLEAVQNTMLKIDPNGTPSERQAWNLMKQAYDTLYAHQKNLCKEHEKLNNIAQYDASNFFGE